MKTSNKILLTLLLTGFGFIAFAELTLREKYLHNDYTDEKEYNSYFFLDYPVGNIKYARIYNVNYCRLIPSDSAKLQVDKNTPISVKYSISGDTLFINRDDSAPRYGGMPMAKLQNIKLFLPQGTHIYAYNSNIDANANKNMQNATRWSFGLNLSVLFTRNQSFTDSSNRYFDSLSISAESSRIYFFHNDHFKTVNLSLSNSIIDDERAGIEHANIIADSNSVVTLSAKNIKKINSAIIKN